jgi:hypothetical protein
VCMFGAFDMPFEVTISELAIELLFPADRMTADAFQSLAREREERSTRISSETGRADTHTHFEL